MSRLKEGSTPFELNNISNLGVYLQHCFLSTFDRVYVVWASFVLLELIAYTSYKDHEWPFSCHKAIGWLLKTSLGLEDGSFDVFKAIFIDRSIQYVGCEHGYTGVIAKVCTKGLP